MAQNTSTRLLREACWYAKFGWAVFPVHTPEPEGKACSCGDADCRSVGKHPRIQDWVNQSTTDLEVIEQWWQTWPRANIGLAVGRSGLVVIDVDPHHGGRVETLPLTAEDRLTPTTRTGSGGQHLIYRAPVGFEISNSGQQLPAGIDVRAVGGFIVAPSSRHLSGRRYAWLTGRAPWQLSLLPLPASLLPLLKIKDEPSALENTLPPVQPVIPTEARHPYAQRAFEAELTDLAQARPGSRNNALNKAAFSLGQFIGAELLPREEVEARLTDIARAIGLGQQEIQRTLSSGIEAGINHPRQWPDLTDRS